MNSQDFVTKFFSGNDNVTIDDKSGWHKVTSKVNSHKIYVQKGDNVKRIDTTLPVSGQEGTRQLKSPNGKITCHLEANEETFGVFVTAMSATDLEKLESKPARPFSPKAPKAPKQPGDSVTATPATATPDKEELAKRLAGIRERAAAARAKRKAEEEGASAEEEKTEETGVDLSAPDVSTVDGAAALRVETGLDVSAEA